MTITTTTLVLIRHGKADISSEYDDVNRPLAEEGREVQRQMAEKLKEEGLFPSRTLCSPLLRAQQTAGIITEVFHAPVAIINALGPQFDDERVLSHITPADKGHTIYLVGHEPSLGYFSTKLVGKRCTPAGLDKSCALVIAFDDEVAFGQGRFVAYHVP